MGGSYCDYYIANLSSSLAEVELELKLSLARLWGKNYVGSTGILIDLGLGFENIEPWIVS